VTRLCGKYELVSFLVHQKLWTGIRATYGSVRDKKHGGDSKRASHMPSFRDAI